MRGTRVNETGDEVDVPVVVYQHVPAALVQTADKTFDPATQIQRTIQGWMCVLPSWAHVDTADTLMQEDVDPPSYFMVESIKRQPSLVPGIRGSLILVLRARSGIGIAQ